MADWDSSLVDPTDQARDTMLIRAIGGKSGPVSYENGAKITFPWKRQQQISGSKPGEIWVRDGSDPANSLDAQTLFIIGADVNSMADAERPKLRLDSYYDAGQDSSITMAAGDSPGAGLQTRIRVSTSRIDLETVPLWTSGGATDGLIYISGATTHFTEVATLPDTDTRVAPLALIQRNFSGGSFTYGGTALLLGHGYVQAGLIGGSPNTISFGASTLQLNPSGGSVMIGGFDYAVLANQLANAWTTYTPTLTQSGAVTKTTSMARYCKLGRLVIGEILLSVTGAGTGNTAIIVGMPVAIHAAAGQPIGGGYVYDANVNVRYPGQVIAATTTTFQFIPYTMGTGGVLGQTASGFGAALASGDAITFYFVYEAAS